MSRQTTKVASCCAVLAALAAGCGTHVAGTPVGQQPILTTSVTTTSPASFSSTALPPTLPEPKTRPRPAATSKWCTPADVTASLGESEGTAGTTYRALVFTNTGRRTCVIQGFPGVSFVAGDDGHQVGAAAAWDGSKGPAVVLAPGKTATAPVGITNIGVFDEAECLPTDVRGFRVYPPQSATAEFVPFATKACAGTTPSNQLKVRTVHKGSHLS